MTTQTNTDGTASEKEKLPAIVGGVQLLLRSLRADFDRRIDDELEHCDLLEFEKPVSLEICEKLIATLREELKAFEDYLAEQESNIEDLRWHIEHENNMYLDELKKQWSKLVAEGHDPNSLTLEQVEMMRLDDLKKKWGKLIAEGHDPDSLPRDAYISGDIQSHEIRKIVLEVGDTRSKKNCDRTDLT